MSMMQFSALYLLSQRDRTALRVPFSRHVTLIRGGNQTGKSAIIKSVYSSFGASPLEPDPSWTSAGIVTSLEFKYKDTEYTTVNSQDRITIYNQDKVPVLQGVPGHELSKAIANFFDFRLVMSDRKGDLVTPNPSYIFAPFYIDQDSAWRDPFDSFVDLNLAGSKRAIVNYHSGMRSNEFYRIAAERDQLRKELVATRKDRDLTDQAFVKLREEIGGQTLEFDFSVFRKETQALIDESIQLNRLQSDYRERISELLTNRAEWKNQQDIIRKCLHEIDATFYTALGLPEQIQCPMCGAEYDNSLLDRFSIVRAEDVLVEARHQGAKELRSLAKEIDHINRQLDLVNNAINRIDAILRIRKNEITFDDVIKTVSRSEMATVFRRRLRELDAAIDHFAGEIQRQSYLLGKLTDPRRIRNIKSSFSDDFRRIASDLGVRTEIVLKNADILASLKGRASERTRALFAYHLAFLRTLVRHSTGVICPFLLDTPNQQGQDAIHLRAIMQSILKYRPSNHQIVIASEEDYGLSESDQVSVFDLGEEKFSALRSEEFQSVFVHLRPFLGLLL